MNRKEKYSEENIRVAVENSMSIKDSLLKMGLRAAGGNYAVLHKYIAQYGISVMHFDKDVGRKRAALTRQTPLNSLLTKKSKYSRTHLKERLYKIGLKTPICEMPGCGQGEIWNGRKMSLILDHVNGVHDDNRIENLRIVCPNCNATLDTHCGKNTPEMVAAKVAEREVAKPIIKAGWMQKMIENGAKKRKVKERPTREALQKMVDEQGYSAVGRTYGVSDNAIRKWLK